MSRAAVFEWGTLINFGYLNDIIWLELIFYRLANRSARKTYHIRGDLTGKPVETEVLAA